jgi:hypothetical protein
VTSITIAYRKAAIGRPWRDKVLQRNRVTRACHFPQGKIEHAEPREFA